MFEFLKSAREPARDRVEPVIGNMIEVIDADSSDSTRMLEIFGSVPTSSGAVVNAVTSNRVSAVYACRRLIAGAISTLPLPVYQRTADGRERVDHPYWWLLNEQPTPRFTAASFWEFVTSDMLFRGDGIAYIVRPANNGVGVTAIVPVRRDNVTIFRMDDRLRYSIYDCVDGKYGYFTVDQDDVLHFPGDTFNGICSLSVIASAARQAIGISMKADEFAGSFYASGAQIQYAVKTPKTMTPPQQNDFRDAWLAKYGAGGRGGISKVPLILTEGLEVQELSMSAIDAQLLESRRFQIADIARAFGVPPHMIGETTASTSWGTGIEQMGIGFVKYTLMPHLKRFAQELNRKLFPTSSSNFFEFNTDGQLAGDSKTQADVLAKALGGPGTQGYMAVNEVRKLKNLPSKPGWDDIKPAGSAPTTSQDNTDEQDPKLLQLVADNAGKPRDFRIEAKGDDATIYVYDVIGGWFGGINETQFVKDVAALQVKNIALRVNSPGGDVFAARAMMTGLAAHPATVTAHIDGLAASAATSLVMAADRIVMTRGARWMVHEAWTIALGNKREFRSQADILNGIDDEIVRDYEARTGKPAAELVAMMEAETWLNADEAKAAGFVDEIVETTKPASNRWNLAAFKNAPKDLLATPEVETIDPHRQNMERRLALLERVAA